MGNMFGSTFGLKNSQEFQFKKSNHQKKLQSSWLLSSYRTWEFFLFCTALYFSRSAAKSLTWSVTSTSLLYSTLKHLWELELLQVINENFERAAQETQNGIYPVVEISGSDVPAPPLRCAPKVMQFNFDDQPVGPPKKTKHVIGKVTSGDLSTVHMNKSEEPPPHASLLVASHMAQSHFDETVVGPSKKAKSKGLIHPNEFDLDVAHVSNGHGKKSTAKHSTKLTRASTSSIQVCVWSIHPSILVEVVCKLEAPITALFFQSERASVCY